MEGNELSEEEKEQIMEQVRIEDDAEAVLEVAGIKRPPVPAITVIRKVIPNITLEFPLGLPHSVEGYALAHLIEPRIGVKPAGTSKSRRRWTLAHELAHILYGRSGTSSKEKEPYAKAEEARANHFAACLLMPTKWVKIYWKALKEERPIINDARTFFPSENIIEDMVRIFKVSRNAMIIRLKNLGLISPEEARDRLDFFKWYEGRMRRAGVWN